MKVIFFGLGSIGQRHARLLLQNFNHDLFAFRSNRKSRPNNIGLKELHSWADVEKISPDAAFITNPTFLHIETSIKCARLGINLFIEKPVDSSPDKLNELLHAVKKKTLTAYVAYNMRFNPIIKKLRRELAGKKSMHCRIRTSSYLPSWRPGTDYRKCYSAKSQDGGGVILDLSHEIDYCYYLFGDILEISGTYGRLSHLGVNSEDYADIIMKSEKGIINLHLNFFSKDLKREIEIDFANGDYIKADVIKKTVLINKHGQERVFKYNFGRDDIYIEQLKYFFKNFKNKKMMNNLEDASRVFKKIITFKRQNEK